MSYSDFTLDLALRAFGLDLEERPDLFEAIPEVAAGPVLAATLAETVPIATSVHTEKARSELIVAPILVEVRRVHGHEISLFSGISFDVDLELGLVGVCDFILARTATQSLLRAPIVTVVEAKKDDLKAGLGQCAAEMVAAQIFNERAGDGQATVFGVVTTGSLWRFLRLDRKVLLLGQIEYSLVQLGKILGALLHCVREPDAIQGLQT